MNLLAFCDEVRGGNRQTYLYLGRDILVYFRCGFKCVMGWNVVRQMTVINMSNPDVLTMSDK